MTRSNPTGVTHDVADLSALALDNVESAEALSELLTHHRPGSDEWRRISGRLGVVLKHASVYAHLALAASNVAVPSVQERHVVTAWPPGASDTLLTFEDVVAEQEKGL